ncbi:hypothetical protein OG216_47925 (plasmid) [Streptomycetaceae bacterium NBC_01309]
MSVLPTAAATGNIPAPTAQPDSNAPTWRCRYCDTYNASNRTTCVVCDCAKAAR